MSSGKRKPQDWISSSQCCLEATPVDGTFFLLSTSVDMLKRTREDFQAISGAFEIPRAL
jgi:hypothetical protein